MTERQPLHAGQARQPPLCVLRDLLHQQARSKQGRMGADVWDREQAGFKLGRNS